MEEVNPNGYYRISQNKKVRDKEEEKIFLPVEDRVEFDGKKVLLDARGNKPWKASKLDEAAAFDKEAVIIGDADRESFSR